jgi:hypothetical protein
MSRRLVFTLSVLSILNYAAVAFLRWTGGTDGARYFFQNRKWTLDLRSDEAFGSLIAIRHWQTVNTVDHSVFVDYGPAIVWAIGPLVVMYLCFRCGLVRANAQKN